MGSPERRHDTAMETGLPKSLGSHLTTACPQVLDTEPEDLMLTLLGFGLVFVHVLSIHLFFHFGMEMFTPHHCLTAVFNFLFYLYRGSHVRVSCSLRGGLDSALLGLRQL